MIVCDTSGILAAYDDTQWMHEAAAGVLGESPGARVLSPFVLAELDYLLATRVGPSAQFALLEEVARGVLQLEPFDAADLAAALRVMNRYRELGIGLADASVVVLSARLGTPQILTLDQRHFRAMTPLQGGAFQLLPFDVSA